MDASSAGTDINVGDTLSLLSRASELCNSGVNTLGKNDVIVIGTRCRLRGIRAVGGDHRLKKAIRDLQSRELRKFEEMRRMQNIALSRDFDINAYRIRAFDCSAPQQAAASSSEKTSPPILSIQGQVPQLEGIQPLLLSSMEEAVVNKKQHTTAFRGKRKADILPILLRTTTKKIKASSSNLKKSLSFNIKSISSLYSLFPGSKKSLIDPVGRKSERVSDNPNSNSTWDDTLISAPTSTMASTMEKPRLEMDRSSVRLLQLQVKRSPIDSSTASSPLKPKLDVGNTGRNKSFGSLALNTPRVAAIREVQKGRESNHPNLMTKISFSSFNSFHKKKVGKISPILASASPELNAGWNL